MNIDRPLRIALYARVSTRDKDQDPELQLDALRAYVEARGWSAVEYVDLAAAGDLAHRTAWTRLLADAARRKVDLVLVWKLDRAFRSTLHALSTLRDFEHAGVGFASLTQPELDTTSPTGRLVFTILAAVAEMERELIADRVREGMRHAARQGKRIGRPPVTARPTFARRWPAIHADLAAGRLSRRQATRRLGIGSATLARLLAAESASAARRSRGSWRPNRPGKRQGPMADRPNPTNAAICGLLAGGPLVTADLAARLGIPARTARYRLARLRQAGAVVTDGDGRHRLAVPSATAAEPAAGLDGPPTAAADRAAPVASTPVPAAGQGGVDPFPPGDLRMSGLAAAAIAVGVLGLAAAGWLGVSALLRRLSPSAPPPPTPFGRPGYPWSGVPWTW